MIGVIISIIIICLIVIIFLRGIKKASTNIEKILLSCTCVIILIPIIIYLIDLSNIPTLLGLGIEVSLSDWRNYILQYISAIAGAIIGAITLVLVTFAPLKKSYENSLSINNEMVRLQNLPLLKYELIDVNIECDNLHVLETKNKQGVLTDINIKIQNVGLNAARNCYMKIESDFLVKSYIFDISKSQIIEKNNEVFLKLCLDLAAGAYNFKVTLFYQDVLYNCYKQEIILKCVQTGIFSQYNCILTGQVIVNNETKIDKIPKFDIDI